MLCNPSRLARETASAESKCITSSSESNADLEGSLAIAEMRLVLAHILFEFDIELMPESVDWLDQRGFSIWEKKPLIVRLHPVKRT